MAQTLRDLLVHLRLHFQLLLAPIYLWGYFLSGALPRLDFWLGFLAFHVFLYGGITAYNSYYDRDEGPIGGLSKPPPVSRALLPFSLGVLAAGAALAAFVNGPFLAIYLAIALMGAAYSHPKVRWKSRPFGGLLVVGLGQGVLASLAGFVAGGAGFLGVTPTVGLGIAAVTLVTVGFYPLTQVYQIEEDRRRGDRTFAVWAGARGTFLFAVAVQLVATALLAGVLYRVMGPVEAVLAGAFYLGILFYTAHWGLAYRPGETLRNFRRVMALNTVTSTGFAALIGLHLFGVL